jgi:hypothetical protein
MVAMLASSPEADPVGAPKEPARPPALRFAADYGHPADLCPVRESRKPIPAVLGRFVFRLRPGSVAQSDSAGMPRGAENDR